MFEPVWFVQHDKLDMFEPVWFVQHVNVDSDDVDLDD